MAFLFFDKDVFKMNLKNLYPAPGPGQQAAGIGSTADDTHTAEEYKTEPPQTQELGRSLPEQTIPGPCDIQTQTKIEKLLSSDELVYGYVYQDGQRSEYMFQGTPENIAYFIGSRPYVDEVIITGAAGWPILSTIGNFIDKCADQELLDEIKKALVPIQKGEAQAQSFFCPTFDEVEEYCAQRDAMDMNAEENMDMGVNIDPDWGF